MTHIREALASLLFGLLFLLFIIACAPPDGQPVQATPTSPVENSPTVRALIPVESVEPTAVVAATSQESPILPQVVVQATDLYPDATPKPTADPRAPNAYPVAALQELEVTKSSQFYPCDFTISYPTLSVEASQITLSEPQIIITDTQGFELIDWLPDSQNLIIMRTVDQIDPDDQILKYVGKSIETLDTVSGQLTLYGLQKMPFNPPVWIEENQSIVIGDLIDEQRVIRELSPDLRSPNTLVTGFGSLFFDIRSTDSMLTFVNDNSPAELTMMSLANERNTISTVLEFLPLTYDNGSINGRKFKWSPDGQQLFMFDGNDFMLAEMTTETACYFDGQLANRGDNLPDQYIYQAEWSPDSRFIAMVISPEPYGRGTTTFLAIFDTTLNEMKIVQRQDSAGGWRTVVSDIAWSQNSQHLASIGNTQTDSDGSKLTQLNFLNVYTDEIQLGGVEGFAGLSGASLVWSPDNRKIAKNCPTHEEGRICIYQVLP